MAQLRLLRNQHLKCIFFFFSLHNFISTLLYFLTSRDIFLFSFAQFYTFFSISISHFNHNQFTKSFCFCGLDYWTVNRRVWFRSSFIVFLTPEILSFLDTWGVFQPSPDNRRDKMCCTRSSNVFFTYQFLIEISFN